MVQYRQMLENLQFDVLGLFSETLKMQLDNLKIYKFREDPLHASKLTYLNNSNSHNLMLWKFLSNWLFLKFSVKFLDRIIKDILMFPEIKVNEVKIWMERGDLTWNSWNQNFAYFTYLFNVIFFYI